MMRESLACPHLRELRFYLRGWSTPPVEAVNGTIIEGGCPGRKGIIEDTNKFLVAIKAIRERCSRASGKERALQR
jgi:hypothetical protein